MLAYMEKPMKFEHNTCLAVTRKATHAGSMGMLATALVLALTSLAPASGPPIAPASPVSITEPSVVMVTPPAPVLATPAEPEFPRVVVLAAILCWNEALDSLADCSTIIDIRMRGAAQHGRTLEEELLAQHGGDRAFSPDTAALRTDRATRVVDGDSRPWLGDIASDLHRPLGWPEHRKAWEDMRPRWQQHFRNVESILAGRIRSRCAGRPLIWGGPVIDEEEIRRKEASGMVIVDCGDSKNVFMSRRRRRS